MIIINFKNYKIGKEVINLAKIIERYSRNAIIAVPQTELRECVKETRIRVFAQHLDFEQKGRGTGKIVLESLIDAGALGSLLNHSENKVPFSSIFKTIKRQTSG